MIETIKEFELNAVRAVRWEANPRLGGLPPASEIINFEGVKLLDGPCPLGIYGIEARAYIGMVKFELIRTRTLLTITAQGLIDYESPERLLLENGELGLDLECRLGAQGATSIPIDADGVLRPEAISVCRVFLSRVQSYASNAMTPMPMSWLFT